ncbi:MAG: hypothetical protein JAY64_00145 [Candidatus Thiodiazotropha weberae]|nr:hypothetical protein [Candidatus Thiodiazotropha lotti]MCG8010103.1 hypothetical protein [Candidatus Thiodiazotropha lotti]MCW4209561.1 hypothetical protein [Candidatus Thiodiazotropha lotti]MCW4216744.1 hypothetical protein [Candidatus Thiodiazotropha lotti]
MREKYIFVLAKSSKPGGLCVAGLELTGNVGSFAYTGSWIRPVAQNAGAIPSDACSDFNVSDIVKIQFDRHEPLPTQPENWLWNGADIETVQKGVNPSTLNSCLTDCEDLWFDSSTDYDYQVSSVHGFVRGINDSLRLIQPQNLVLDLVLETRDAWESAKKKVYANFSFKGRQYSRIPLTDPKIRHVLNPRFSKTEDEVVSMPLRNGDGYWLTVSLSPPFGGNSHHYVLVAGVIEHNGYLNRNYNG